MTGNPYDLVILKPGDSLDDWDKFVDESPQGSLTCRSWWLKTVCPANFQILTVVKSGKIIAGMPISISLMWRHSIISMPPFTQTLGILFAPSQKRTYEARLSDEMKLMDFIIQNIPHFDYFSINFHQNFNNWLPFYWERYRQTTRYTYMIPDISDLNKLLENMSQTGRNVIKKASNRYSITITESNDVRTLLRLNDKTFTRQGIKVPFSEEVVTQIYKESSARNAGKIFLAKDPENNVHSAIFFVYDSKSTYGLISGGDPKFRESGANALNIWHSIEYANKVTASYNFGGSMIKNIELFMRSFGAVQTPYYNISKDNRRLPLRMNYLLYAMDDRIKRSIRKK